MSAEEVTQRVFRAVQGYDPSSHACDECPVENVSWAEAAAYCDALSAAEAGEPLETCYACSGAGVARTCDAKPQYAGAAIYGCPGFRLPTEAEFELAYRAGSTSDLYNGDLADPTCGSDLRADEIAVYKGNAGDRTRPIKTKAPNAWGLYDMAGNVWNWCHDRFAPDLGGAAVVDPAGSTAPGETRRAVRGGSYFYFAGPLRAAARAGVPVTFRSPATGIRCVRTLLR